MSRRRLPPPHCPPAPVSPLGAYITGLGADGARAGLRSAASVSGERCSSTHGGRWSSTQEAASRSSWAAARACSDVSIDPCSASTHTTTSPSSFCTVAISTEEPSSVRTVDQRGPSWPPGSMSQSACLVWHQLGHEPRLKRSSARVMVPVYPVPTTTRRRMVKMCPDRETCGIREASGRGLGPVWQSAAKVLGDVLTFRKPPHHVRSRFPAWVIQARAADHLP